jgi:hypothetical protein
MVAAREYLPRRRASSMLWTARGTSMKPNRLPPDILKLLPPPGPDHLSPGLLEELSPGDRKKVLDRVPREKPEAMVDHVVGWIDMMNNWMTTEHWHRRLQDSIRPALLAGKLSVMQVIAAAEKNRQIDLALRKILVVGDLPADVASLPALQAYKDRALLRDITTNPSNRPQADYIDRDIGIATLMTLSMVRWPYLRKSVSRASRKPSASKIVAAALSRRGISLTPDGVLNVFDNYDLLVGRVVSLFPAV